MADKKIGDVTHDDSIGGNEKLPMDDAGTAKYATTGDLKDYTLSQIAAIAAASGIDLAVDGVYLLKGGALKPVASEALASAVLDYGFGKVAVASMNGNEIVGVKDASSQKTITVNQLKSWLQENMTVTVDVSIGAKSAAGFLSGEDLLLIAQSGTNKKLTLTTLTSYVHAAFKAYVSGLTAAQTITGSDTLYIINGTEAKRCTLSQIQTLIGSGDVVAPEVHTAGNVPTWDNANKKLTSGYGIASQISSEPSATKLVTEAAVSDAVSVKVDKVTGKGLSENDYSNTEKAKVAALSTAILAWASGKAYSIGDYCRQDGKICKCVVANSSETFDASQWEYVPSYPTSGADTEKFLRQDGTWNKPPQSEDFVGATSGETPSAGTHGLVPAPTTTDVEKFLKGDGSWSSPTDNCAKISVDTTASKIPQWSSLSKTLSDGLVLVKSTDTVVVGADKDTMLPTLKEAENLVADLAGRFEEKVVITNETPTAGTIPLWMTPSEGGNQLKKLEGHKSIVTAVGTTTSDANIPTEKAVADHVSLMNGFAKLASETLSSGTTKSLTNHAIHVFGIATGGTYTLSVPTSVEGRSREFYVTFVQSGTEGATSTIVLSSQTSIHSKSGTVQSLSVKKDVAGESNAFHVYHFFEDYGQIWCVNEFEFSESQSASVEKRFVEVNPSESENISIERENLYRVNQYTNNVDAFTLDFGASSAQSRIYFSEMFIVCGQTLPTTVGLKIGGNTPSVIMLPEGNSGFVSLLTAGKATSFRIAVQGDGTLIVQKIGVYSM